MKHYLMLGTALTPVALMLGSGALAQSRYDWSGPYVGITAGMVETRIAGTDDAVVPETFAFAATLGVLGLGAGYNWQSGDAVIGFETDFTAIGSEIAGVTANAVTVESGLDKLITARIRAGYAADRVLFFATAGLAAGNATLATSHSDGFKTASASDQRNLLGLVAGAGIEFAANDNLTLKLEGLYYRLKDIDLEATSGFSHEYGLTGETSGTLLRGGVNLKF